MSSYSWSGKTDCKDCVRGRHAWNGWVAHGVQSLLHFHSYDVSYERKCRCCTLTERMTEDEYRQTQGNSGSNVAQGGGSPHGFPQQNLYSYTYSTGVTPGSSVTSGTIFWGYPDTAQKLLDLPTRTSNEPFRGYKIAKLDQNGTFTGVGFARSYKAEDEAICAVGYLHQPPDLGCSCGFYAHDAANRALSLLLRLPSTATLEVELYGRVIVCETGYRAQYQRVLKATIPASFQLEMTDAELSSLFGCDCTRR